MLYFPLTTKNDINKNTLGVFQPYYKKKIFQKVHKCMRKHIKEQVKIYKTPSMLTLAYIFFRK